MENQGKRKEQVEYSEKVVYYSFIGILALLLIFIITR
jgi:hypothetical protein